METLPNINQGWIFRFLSMFSYYCYFLPNMSVGWASVGFTTLIWEQWTVALLKLLPSTIMCSAWLNIHWVSHLRSTDDKIFDREKWADTSTRKRYPATLSYRSSKSEEEKEPRYTSLIGIDQIYNRRTTRTDKDEIKLQILLTVRSFKVIFTRERMHTLQYNLGRLT